MESAETSQQPAHRQWPGPNKIARNAGYGRLISG